MRFALSLTGNDSLAEDLVQETMLRAVRRAEKLSEVDNPRAWLFTVAINLWRDQCRQRKRRPDLQPLHLNEELVSVDPNADPETREQLAQVLDWFRHLPERQREVLYLRTVEGHSITEIGAITGTSESNVKANLSIARKRMRQKFADNSKEQVKP